MGGRKACPSSQPLSSTYIWMASPCLCESVIAVSAQNNPPRKRKAFSRFQRLCHCQNLMLRVSNSGSACRREALAIASTESQSKLRSHSFLQGTFVT